MAFGINKIPLPAAQLTDPKTGIIDQYWYDYLQTLASDLAQIKADLAALGVTSGRGRFYVYRGGLAAGLTASAYNKVDFDTVLVDSAGWYDMTNHRYVPQEAGLYWIFMSVAVDSLVTAETTQAVLRKNGGLDVAKGMYAANVGSAGGAMSAGVLVGFNGTTDFVEGFAWLPAGLTTIPGGLPFTFIGGWKVGET